MHRRIGINNTNTINRYGFRVEEQALVNSLWDTSEVGVPSYLSHDQSKPVGWVFPLAMHFEPGIVRSTHLYEFLDDINDFEYRLFNFNYLRSQKKADEIEQLRSLLKDRLLGQEKLLLHPTIAFLEKDLAVRMFSSIFLQAEQDRDGLVSLHKLKAVGPGVFQIGPLLVFAHSYLRRSLFPLNTLNKDFLEKLQNLDKNLSPRIALDRDLVGLASDYHDFIELMYLRGPKFNHDLSHIPVGVTVHQSTDEDLFWTGVSKTEFWWKQQNAEYVFEVEEIVNHPVGKIEDGDNFYGCRYVHSIVLNETGIVRHLDGAIRMYSEEAMIGRLDKSINKAGKHSIYTKLWRVDGEIDIQTWKDLVANYFRENILVAEYLSGTDKELLDSNEQNIFQGTQPEKFQYVPYSMSSGDGIRITITYNKLPNTEVNSPFTHKIKSFEGFTSYEGGSPTRGLELDSIELFKLLRLSGANVEIEENILLIDFMDEYINFPTVFHSRSEMEQSIELTQKIIRSIISKWITNEYDTVITYSIGFYVEDREVLISIMGHIHDINLWLQSDTSRIPITKDEISTWAVKISEYLDTNYPKALDKPRLSSTLMETGLLSIQREQILAKKQEYFVDKSIGLKLKLQFEDNDDPALILFKNGAISPCVGLLIEDAECSKCGDPYPKCKCSALLDDRVTIHIKRANPLVLFWTDKPKHKF